MNKKLITALICAFMIGSPLYGGARANAAEAANTAAVSEDSAAQTENNESEEPKEPHQHSFVSVSKTEATCTAEGVEVFECECGESYTMVTPKLAHTYRSVSKTAPTCTESGKEVFKCECGDSYTKTTPKLGHSLTKVKVVAPTLKAKGYTLYRCSRCGEEIKKEYTAMLKDVSKASVSNVKASYSYTGKAIKPNPTVKYGNTTLKKGTDYTVSYSANTKKGTAKLTIKGKGKYGGSKAVTYKIAAAKMSNATVSGLKSYKKYTGKATSQAITVSFNGKTLKKGTDYTISYKNNVNVGTAQLIIKGKGNFTGTLTKKYKVVRTGWFKYKGNYYYYSSKGKKYTSGQYKIGSNYYYFAKSGVMQRGWQKVGSNYCLFDRASGKKVFNKTVDGIAINKNGNAKLTDWSKSKIATMMKANKIMRSITNATDSMETKRLKCFNWVLSFPYHQYRLLRPIMRQDGWEMTFANDIFDYHQGCCVAESAATAFLFREIGYTDVYVCHDTAHSWVTIGQYLYDPVFAEGKDFSKNYNVLPYDYRVNPYDKRYIG
ncbi:MAG: hypothetical protein J6O40_04090 [Ruminococcus sp.]|nr:hypothetical protein [Ruminococcus sp.]